MSLAEFVEKYKYAIIITLAVHLILFVWFALDHLQIVIGEYGYVDNEDRVVAVLDFSADEQIPDISDMEALQNSGANPLMNVTQNTDLEKTTYTDQADPNTFSKSAADAEVLAELLAIEKAEFAKINAGKEDLANDQETDGDAEHTVDPNLVKQGADHNDDASYGMDVVATASYWLPGRNPLADSKPSYVCKSKGIVRIDIKVNQKGRVIGHEINEKYSTTTNVCLRNAAMEYAKKWRFTQNFNDEIRKAGWIEFQYVAQ